MSSIWWASRPIRQGDHVIPQIGDDRQLAPVQGGVADAVDAVLGGDLQGDEVAPRAGDDDLGVGDFQHAVFRKSWSRALDRRRARPAGPEDSRKGSKVAWPIASFLGSVSSEQAAWAAGTTS
jgi:hypothetical protein